MQNPLSQLSSNSPADRSQGLEVLRDTLARESALPLLGSSRDALFREHIPGLLRDRQWNVVHQALQLVEESCAVLGPTAVDALVTPLVPDIITQCLGDVKVVLRRQASRAIAAAAHYGGDPTAVLDSLVPHVLESPSTRLRAEAVATVARVPGPPLRRADLSQVTDALIVALSDPSDDVTAAAIGSLEYLSEQVPDLDAVLARLSEDQRTLYEEVMGDGHESPVHDEYGNERFEDSAGSGQIESGAYEDEYEYEEEEEEEEDEDEDEEDEDEDDEDAGGSREQDGLAMGFIPAHLIPVLRDASLDWQLRASAIEELHTLSLRLRDPRPVLPHLRKLCSFVGGLVDDTNFKISLTALQIWERIVRFAGPEMRPVALAVVASLVEKLGDNKVVIRQAVARVLAAMMHAVGEGAVLAGVVPNVEHRNWHVREEVLSIMAQAVVARAQRSTPHTNQPQHLHAGDIDLAPLVSAALQAVQDTKPRVRLAAYTLLAAVGRCHGRRVLDDLVERGSPDDSRVTRAFRGSVADRAMTLPSPTLDEDGVLERSADTERAFREFDEPPLSSSFASSASGSTDQNSGGGGYTPRDMLSPMDDQPPVSARRIASAGRAKSRQKAFPWEKDGAARSQQQQQQQQQQYAPEDLPPKQRSVSAKQPTSGRRARPPSGNGGDPSGVGGNGFPSSSSATSSTSYEPSFGDHAAPQPRKASSARIRTSARGHASEPSTLSPVLESSQNINGGSNNSNTNGKIGLWLGTDKRSTGIPNEDDIDGQEDQDEEGEGSPPVGFDRATVHGLPSASNNAHEGSPRSSRSVRSYDSREIKGQLSLLKSRRNSTRQGIRNSPPAAAPHSPAVGRSAAPVGSYGNDEVPVGGGANRSTDEFGEPDANAMSSSGAGDERPIAPRKAVDFSNFDPKAFANAYPDGTSPPPSPLVPERESSSSAATTSVPKERRVSQATLNRRKSQAASARQGSADPSHAGTPSLINRRAGRSATHAADTSPSRGSRLGPNGINSHHPRTPSTAGGPRTPIMPKSNDKTGAIDDVPTSALEPCADPPGDLKRALKDLSLSDSDWDACVAAMLLIRRVVVHHPREVTGDRSVTPTIVKQLTRLADSLRSSVSKNALVALSDMCASLGRAMDAEVTRLIPFAMTKVTGSVFIAEVVDELCASSVSCQTPTRVMQGLIAAAGHKNPVVRSHAAWVMAKSLDTWLPEGGGGLSGSSLQQLQKDLERFMPTLQALLSEAAVEARRAAKQCVYILVRGLGQDAVVRQCGGRCAKVVEEAKKAATGGASVDIPSTGRRAGSGRRVRSSTSATSMRSSASSGSGGGGGDGMLGAALRRDSNQVPSTPGSRRAPSAGAHSSQGSSGPSVPLPSQVSEELPGILTSLGSADWRARHSGLEQLFSMVGKHPSSLEHTSVLVPAFDKLGALLNDANSKVAGFALQTVTDILPMMKPGSGADGIVHTLIPSLCGCLASGTQRTRDMAGSAISALAGRADVGRVARALGDVASRGNVRILPEVLMRLSEIVRGPMASRTGAVRRHVTPIALNALTENKVEVRSANARLLKALHEAGALDGEGTRDQQSRIRELLRA